MNVRSKLDMEFSKQKGLYSSEDGACLQKSIITAEGYAITECALAVLSDLKEHKSYIFDGGFAQTLDIDASVCNGEINSIWEQNILDVIHPDDLEMKMLNELLYFHHIQKASGAMRFRQNLWQQVRIRRHDGDYMTAMHRLYYIPDSDVNTVRFALCLYGPLLFPMQNCAVVINNINGTNMSLDVSTGKDILSHKEISVLQMIANGMSSKEIARQLSISVHTVSRHRQNINAKLQVHNSMEAYRIARSLGIVI